MGIGGARLILLVVIPDFQLARVASGWGGDNQQPEVSHLGYGPSRPTHPFINA